MPTTRLIRLLSTPFAAFAIAGGLLLAPPATAKKKPRKAPAHTILWGAYMEGPSTYGSGYQNPPWDMKTWRTFEAHAGKKVSIVHWGVRSFWEASFNSHLSQHRRVLAAGAVELIDVNSGDVPLRDIAAGAYDGPIRAWAAEARHFGRAFFLRWNWEMNASWFPWGTTASNHNSPADFVAAWRHIHDLFAAASATNVTWVWCPNVSFRGSVPLASLYPGDAYVDWTCLDGYNKGGANSAGFRQIFGPSYHALLRMAPRKPIMIGETASVDDGGRKPGWITNALAELRSRFRKVKAFTWFNWHIDDHDGTWQWQIESSPQAQAAFARAIASPYFIPGGRIRPPRLAPIQPPR